MREPGILFQHFYYPTPELPTSRSWWRQATEQLAELARLGIWGIWHPVPVKGGSGRFSMGYDPYDYYDLGSKDQRGSVATHFGTRDEYLAYVATAHTQGLSVIADVVLNHCGGADQAQISPVQERLGWDDISDDTKVPLDHLPPDYDPKRDNLRAWSGFNPKGADGRKGSGRFPRDWRSFHPTTLHPDHNEPYHHPDFGSDFCPEAEDGYIAKSFLAWSEWFMKQSGVDGYRLDAVKLMEPAFLRDFAAHVRPDSYLVGEFWDTNPKLLGDFQSATENRMRLFDFGLFYALKDLTEKPNFDLRTVLSRRFRDRARAVMFVSNHDVDRSQAIEPTKRGLPYALMLAQAGQPSVFYHDYFSNPELAVLLKNLIPLARAFATGQERVLLATPDQLVIERQGGLLAQFWTSPTRPNLLLPQLGRGRTLTAQGPGFAYLTPTSALASPRPAARATTQTFEFDDDLDTGSLGKTQRSVQITAAGGSALLARLTGAYGEGSVLIELRDTNGRGIAAATAPRGRAVVLRAHLPTNGSYRFLITAPGNPTTAALTVVYHGAP